MLRSPDLPQPPGAYLYPSPGRECMDPGPGPWNSALPVIRPSLRARCLLGFGSRRPVTRRERVMVPPEKKDATYMSNRLKNNEAARRSREKRRLKDLLLEGQLLALSEENAHLRNEVLGLRYLSMCARKDTPASGWGLCPSYVSPDSKPPIWGENQINPGITPSFSWPRGFDPAPPSSGLLPACAPRVPPAVAGMEGSGVADMDAPRQVAFGAALKADAFLPGPDALHPGAIFPYRPTARLVPSPAVDGGFTQPWLSPLLAPTTPYPSLPVCTQETFRRRPGAASTAH